MVVGILSRENLATSIALNAGFAGKTLQILVENQGRINYNVANDFKGLGEVLFNGQALQNWTLTGFPLDDGNQIEDLISEYIGNDVNDNSGRISSFSSDILQSGPIIFHTTFDIDADEIYDTYVNPVGWGKVRLSIFTHGINQHSIFDLFYLCFRELYSSMDLIWGDIGH